MENDWLGKLRCAALIALGEIFFPGVDAVNGLPLHALPDWWPYLHGA